MKQFFKFMLASVIGVIAASFIFFLVGIMTLVSMTAQQPTTVKEKSVYVLNLSGIVEERHAQAPFEQLWSDQMPTYGLDDLLASIEKAKENKNIEGIYLEAGAFGCSPASMQEIHDALLRFKESGKFIVAYGGTYTQGAYYIASVADKLIVNPSGSLGWHGLSTQLIFYKDLMKKIGVDMQIFRVGTYKSAVEPYIGTEMSAANREQTSVYLQSIWNRLVADVAASRHITAEQLNELADENMDFQKAEMYVQYGLADTLMYKDQVNDYLKSLVGAGEKEKLHTLTTADMINLPAAAPKKSKNIIAMYYAYGEIDGAESVTGSGIVSGKVINDLRKLRENDKVKAVVLRVNSPGGSAYGSEQIWREVSLLKEKKPVVVSMGDYAASGGYYISCAADIIVAEPTTLTGSIGIFGMVPDASELMTKKLGLHFDGVKTNELADMNSAMRPLNNEEKQIMQNMVNNGYELFVRRCADGRKMDVNEIKRIAEGRVWTGEMAQKLNLVDELGDIERAISLAAEAAGAPDDYRIERYPEKVDFLTSLMATPESYIKSCLQERFGVYYKGLNLLKDTRNIDRLQARMPFDLTIE